MSSSDCSPNTPCVVTAGGQRVCRDTPCGYGGVGRPFLIDGTARLSRAVVRSDWSSALTPRVEDLDADVRTALAERWSEIGLMEHASIAANARFSLELLSLGAPADLVAGAYEAMSDETAHARDAFALASTYAGRPVGPGALDVSRAMAACSPIAIVETAILEGCIGETVAAVEAVEALATAEDEAVRAALQRIAVDETRHAELVWRFVKWVLDHGDPLIRQRTAICLVDSLDAERRAVVGPAPKPDEQSVRLRSHGVLDSETRREIRLQVLLEVIEPCARALVARSACGWPPGGRCDRAATAVI